MFRKFLIYFLYYIPIYASIKVIKADDIIINESQLAISNTTYWIADGIFQYKNTMTNKLVEFPDNYILILSNSKHYRYIHFIRSTISESNDVEIFMGCNPLLEKLLVNEYLETTLLKF